MSNHPSDSPATCCPTCGGDGTIDPLDDVQVGSVTSDNEALLAKVIADAQVLADVRTLDDWRRVSPQTRDVYLRADAMVVLRRHDYPEPWCFEGATPDEARAKAAAWVRSEKERGGRDG